MPYRAHWTSQRLSYVFRKPGLDFLLNTRTDSERALAAAEGAGVVRTFAQPASIVPGKIEDGNADKFTNKDSSAKHLSLNQVEEVKEEGNGEGEEEEEEEDCIPIEIPVFATLTDGEVRAFLSDRDVPHTHLATRQELKRAFQSCCNITVDNISKLIFALYLSYDFHFFMYFFNPTLYLC